MGKGTGVTPEEQWEILAKKDPRWASCTRGKLHYSWQLKDFLATGEEELSWVMQVAAENAIQPHRKELAVDFGCGPGRLIGALKSRFARVVGVDVSPTMLTEARRVHREDRVDFTLSTNDLDQGSVDFIYSSFVLQHLTQAKTQESLREFARLLNTGGLLVFQYPIGPGLTLPGVLYRVLPLRLTELFKVHVLRYPAGMPMSWMSPSRMQEILGSAGLVVVTWRARPSSPHWRDAWYFVKREER
jgi:SAM-dependent methyltransferase